MRIKSINNKVDDQCLCESSNPCTVCEDYIDGVCTPKVCDPCQECVNGVCTAKTCGPCETCINGVCSTTCLFCETCVDGQCVSNCDVCSECTVNGCQTKDCPPCHTCVNGICVYPCLACETCDANEQCVLNCGPCEQCTSTGCVSSCGPCETCVNGVCTSACGPCEQCINGVCTTTCGLCETCVNGACTNIVCPASCQSCVNGVCVDTCTTPDTTCVTPTLTTDFNIKPWNRTPKLRNQCCECLYCGDCPGNLYCPTTTSNATDSGGTLCKCGPQCTDLSKTSQMFDVLSSFTGDSCSICYRINSEISSRNLRCVNGVITEKDNKRICVGCNVTADCSTLTCTDPLKKQKACVNKDCVCVECLTSSHCTSVCQAQGFVKGTCATATNTCNCTN